MGTRDSAGDPGDNDQAGSELTVLSPAVVATYEAMIATVPEAGAGGFESILEQLANATDVYQLDAPWRSAGLADYRNRRLVVTGIRRMVSDFAGGLPWFLILDAADRETGEKLAITTGAVSVVAQLVKAWDLGKFPLEVIPRVADRASSAGYYPMHLEMVRR